MDARMIYAGIGTLALIGGLAACGGGGSTPAASQSSTAQGKAWAVADYNSGDIAMVISEQVLVSWVSANDPNAISTQAGAQWALGAEAGYEQTRLIGQTTSDGASVTSANVDPTTFVDNGDGSMSYQGRPDVLGRNHSAIDRD